jgi:hypothetical protein
MVASDTTAGIQLVIAHMPRATLFNDASAVFSLSKRWIKFLTQLAYCWPVPKAVQAKLLAPAV